MNTLVISEVPVRANDFPGVSYVTHLGGDRYMVWHPPVD